MNVWFVDKIGDGWGEPQFLGSPFNDYRPVFFSIANDGTLYFTRSNPREIWYAELQDDGYKEAQSLPDEINYLPDIAHPAIAPDESYIIVDSVIRKGGVLVGTLFISFQRLDGVWTEAVSMYEVLQASETDIYAIPRISPDGKYLFFENYIPETDQADILWVSTDIIEALRSEMLDKENADNTTEEKPTVSVGLFSGEGAHEGCVTPADGMFSWMEFDVTLIDAETVNQDDLSPFDILYFPGGSAGPYQEMINAEGREKIRAHVSAGGCFIGTCAGALYAAEKVIWEGNDDSQGLLGLFSGAVEGPIPEIYKDPEIGMCQVNLETHPITEGEANPAWIMYFNGPFFRPNPDAEVDIIGRYEIGGEPAIVASAYGQGRVVLTGPHPEWEEDSDRDDISYFDDFEDHGSDWDLMLSASLWCIGELE